MRVMAKISMPVGAANQAIKDHRIAGIMQRAAERWKPEAMYFGSFDGRRTAFVIFDMSDPSDMPPFAEPFFMELEADVEMSPVMNGADLERGLSQIS
jgi:hypothetical protein